MSLKAPVYATRITSLSDARYFAGMGVQYLGICADPASSDHFSALRFREISGWINGPMFVLEVDGMNGTPDFSQLMADYGVSLFRISPAQIESASDAGVRFGLTSDGPVESAEFIVRSNLEDERSTWGGPIVFAVGIRTPSDVNDLLEKHPGTGIVVHGSPETEPGLKSYDPQDLLEFLDADL